MVILQGFQTYELPAWAKSRSVRLVKAPKLIWFDLGVQRALSGQREGLTGEQYESAMVGQVLTTLAALGRRVEAAHLRTSGGLEVDLILEGAGGILAVEMKNRPKVDRRDATAIERARKVLGDRYRGGLVVYRGAEIAKLSETVWAVPDWRLLG